MNSKSVIKYFFGVFMVGTAFVPSLSWAMDPKPPLSNIAHPPVILKKRLRSKTSEAKSETQQVINLFSWTHFPSDIFHFIMLKYCMPIEWAKLREVCKDWQITLDHKNLWQHAVGGNLPTTSQESDKKALAILKDLFKEHAIFPKMFGIDSPLEPILPTGDAYRNYYIFCYNERVKKNKEIVGGVCKIENLRLAYKLGHAQAAYEMAKLYSKSKETQLGNLSCLEAALGGNSKAKARLFQKTFNGFLQEESQNKENQAPSSSSSSSIKTPVVQNQLPSFETFIAPIENRDLNVPPSQLVALHLSQLDQPMQVDQVIPSPSTTIQKFIEWADYCPQGRRTTLICLLPNVLDIFICFLPNFLDNFSLCEKSQAHCKISDNLLKKFEKIGNGTAKFLSFTSTSIPSLGKIPFNKKWSEAFLLIAEEYDRRVSEINLKPYITPEEKKQKEDYYTQAKTYFIKAFEGNAENSAPRLAQFLEPVQNIDHLMENIDHLICLTKDARTVRTAHSKLCQIALGLIPPIAMDDDHPTIIRFVEALNAAYDAFLARDNYLPAIAYREPQPGSDPNLPIKSIYDLIRKLDLNRQVLPIQRAYIEWALERKLSDLPLPLESALIEDYLKIKWGTDFVNYGTLKGKDVSQWTRRDTLYANQHFSKQVSLMIRRTFFTSLMDIALKKAKTFIEAQKKTVIKEEKETLIGFIETEKETFTTAFKKCCDIIKLYPIGKTHCEILDKNLKTFLALFPMHAELPIIYANLLQTHNKWTTTQEKDNFIENAINRVQNLAIDGSIEARDYFKLQAKNSSPSANKFVAFLSKKGSTEEPENKKRKLALKSASSGSEDD